MTIKNRLNARSALARKLQKVGFALFILINNMMPSTINIVTTTTTKSKSSCKMVVDMVLLYENCTRIVILKESNLLSLVYS